MSNRAVAFVISFRSRTYAVAMQLQLTAAIRILAMYAPPGDRGAFVDGILAHVIDVFPPETSWREAFAAYDGYMRASETDVLSVAEGKSPTHP